MNNKSKNDMIKTNVQGTYENEVGEIIMKRLFEEIKRLAARKEASVMAAIVAGHGSVPRGAGARMLIKKDGTTMGTIGGGMVEYKATQMALEVLRKKRSCLKGFSLTRDEVAGIGMVCGGNVTVFFQYLDENQKELLALCDQILDACEKNEDSWLLTDLTEETDWTMELYIRDGAKGTICQKLEEGCLGARAEIVQKDGGQYYIEPLRQAGKVYVFGGGHVAQELVPLLTHLDFHCVVCDDREEFSNSRVFPEAEETITGTLDHVFAGREVRESDFIVIMTRGHQYDYLVQKQALKTKAGYIGVMGSRNKIRVVTEKLLEDGFSEEEIRRCHMPIGLAIQAETPAEIAVSIAGQLIQIRAEKSGKRKRS